MEIEGKQKVLGNSSRDGDGGDDDPLASFSCKPHRVFELNTRR